MQDDFLKPEIRLDFQVSEKRKKIWSVQIDLIKELDRVCKKYNLRYYASNGTLLGVIRHGGYIPWDDDVDIVMPRPDYNKLCEVAKMEFASPCILQNAMTESNYYRNYSRLRNANTTAMPYRDWNRNCTNGIFVDIFPMDGCKNDSVSDNIRQLKIKFYNALANTYVYYPDFSNHMWLRAILMFMAKTYCKLFSYEQLLKKIEMVRSKTDYNSAEYIFTITHKGSFLKFPRAYYEKSIWMNFEDIKLPVPGEYDTILKAHYGEYMELPPVEERGMHHEILFDPDVPYTEYLGKMTKEEAQGQINNY